MIVGVIGFMFLIFWNNQLSISNLKLNCSLCCDNNYCYLNCDCDYMSLTEGSSDFLTYLLFSFQKGYLKFNWSHWNINYYCLLNCDYARARLDLRIIRFSHISVLVSFQKGYLNFNWSHCSINYYCFLNCDCAHFVFWFSHCNHCHIKASCIFKEFVLK